jgi:hypothetical protein
MFSAYFREYAEITFSFAGLFWDFLVDLLVARKNHVGQKRIKHEIHNNHGSILSIRNLIGG